MLLLLRFFFLNEFLQVPLVVMILRIRAIRFVVFTKEKMFSDECSLNWDRLSRKIWDACMFSDVYSHFLGSFIKERVYFLMCDPTC